MRNHTGKEDLYTFPRSGSSAFCLELMGTSYCDGDYYIERHNVNTWVFEFVLHGKGTVCVNDKTYHPCTGQAYIIPAYSDHHYYADPADPWTKIWFNVSGSLIPSLLSTYGLADTVLIDLPALEPIFHKAQSECLDEPINAHRTAVLAIHEIIAIIAQHRPAAETKVTQPLRDYLATHVNEAVSSQRMAEIQSLSVSQTIRLFKKDWQITPYKYHLQCRLRAAELLLKSSTKTIREVSENLGFSDEYYFASLFKKQTGLSPGRFRISTPATE